MGKHIFVLPTTLTLQEENTNQETVDAFSYSVTNSGNPTAQLALATNYVNTMTEGSGNQALATLPCLRFCYANWKSWAAGFNPAIKICAYEGGNAPNGATVNGVSTITGASNATQCVLTLSNYSIDGGNTVNSGNPAVAGMTLTISGVSGMTQLNGNTYTVVSVAGNNVTINVNSTGFGTWTAGGTATYVNSQTWVTALRVASKSPTSNQFILTAAYNDFINAGFEFPSMLVMGGPSTFAVWSPDIYAATPPQWNAIVAFNTLQGDVNPKDKF